MSTQGKLKADIDNWFTYHSPNTGQIEQMKSIRDLAKALAHRIGEIAGMNMADRMAAIRKVRKAVMAANAGIVCEEQGLSFAELRKLAEKLKDEAPKPDPFPYYPYDGLPAIPRPPWPQYRPCRYCSQPIGIVGSWTCPECGRFYPGNEVSWASDATGHSENTD